MLMVMKYHSCQYCLINYIATDSELSIFRQKIFIKSVTIHPDYDPSTNIKTHPNINDISIVKLKTPLIFNQNVIRACLPESSFTPPSQAVVSGWGQLANGMYSRLISCLRDAITQF